MRRRRRARRRNPSAFADSLFQVVVGVVTAVVAAVVIDRMRESRDSAVLPHAPVDGWDVA
jgi:hypothetical protein